MKCKICKNKVNEFNDDKFENTYYICPECVVIFLKEEDIISEKEEKKEYDRHENTMENNGYVNSFREIIDKYIIEYAGELKGKKILDFGCGPNPVLAKILKKYKAQVDHYDPFFFNDITLENNQYDLVISTEVFEHLKKPYKELELISSCLKPSGYLVIKTQFHNNNIDDFLTWWYRRDPTHIIFYTPKTFEYMAKIIGFDIIFTDNEELIILKRR